MNKFECFKCSPNSLCHHKKLKEVGTPVFEVKEHICTDNAHVHHDNDVILFSSFQRKPEGSDHDHAGCNHSHNELLFTFNAEDQVLTGGGFQQANIFEELKHEKHVHCPQCDEHVEGDYCLKCNIRVIDREPGR